MNQHAKETIKGTLNLILIDMPAWYTVPDLAKLLPAKTPLSTIARALRKLFEEGQVTKQRDPNNYRYMQWSASGSATTNAIPVATGDITMEIAKAVEQIVTTEFIAKNLPFSAHDITNALRAAVAAGTITVDAAIVGTVHVGSSNVARIEHPLVRDAVHALWTNQSLPGYTRAYEKDAQGQSYTKYSPVPVAPITVAVAVDDDGNDVQAVRPDVNYDGSSSL